MDLLKLMSFCKEDLGGVGRGEGEGKEGRRVSGNLHFTKQDRLDVPQCLHNILEGGREREKEGGRREEGEGGVGGEGTGGKSYLSSNGRRKLSEGGIGLTKKFLQLLARLFPA